MRSFINDAETEHVQNMCTNPNGHISAEGQHKVKTDSSAKLNRRDDERYKTAAWRMSAKTCQVVFIKQWLNNPGWNWTDEESLPVCRKWTQGAIIQRSKGEERESLTFPGLVFNSLGALIITLQLIKGFCVSNHKVDRQIKEPNTNFLPFNYLYNTTPQAALPGYLLKLCERLRKEI